MRRNAAWTVASLALAALTPTAHAQYYPGYGYYQPPAYRVAPMQYYPMPGGGHYQYRSMPASYQGYRPMPAYMAQPSYAAQPGYVVSQPSYSHHYVPATPVNRSGDPIIVVPDSTPANLSNGNPTPIVKSLPASTPEIVVVPDSGSPPPPYVPSHIPGVLAEEYPDSCVPGYSMPAYAMAEPPDPERHCHIMAGIGAMYVRPSFTNNTALSISNLGGGSGSVDFSDDYEVAPLGWLAVVNQDGLGFRARYWQLQQDDSLSALNNGFQRITLSGLGLSSAAAGELATTTNTLDMSVADIEAIWSHDKNLLTWVCAVGARWTDLEQARHGSVTNATGRISALSRHDFEGLGPTLALEMTCGLSRCIAVYVNGRASFLYGNREFNRFSTTVNLSSEEDWINAYETEAGMQFALPVGKCHLVSRVGVTGQTWLDAGSSVTRNGHLDLVGGILQVGFHY